MPLPLPVSTTSQAATAAAQGSLYQFFAPGGPLSKTHPAYEFRRGQLLMAEAVEQALKAKQHLVVEAGTGTGKTLAYLLPVIRGGKCVIWSPVTKTLQEPRFHTDVPCRAQHIADLQVGDMRVPSKYLWRKRLYARRAQPGLNGVTEIEQYRAIAEW